MIPEEAAEAAERPRTKADSKKVKPSAVLGDRDPDQGVEVPPPSYASLASREKKPKSKKVHPNAVLGDRDPDQGIEVPPPSYGNLASQEMKCIPKKGE